MDNREGMTIPPQETKDEVQEHHCDKIPQKLILAGIVQVAFFKGVPGILIWSPAKDARTAFRVRYCPWCGKDSREWL